jgi:hypothetical protein
MAALFWFVGPPEVRPHILPVIAPIGIVVGLVAAVYFRWKGKSPGAFELGKLRKFELTN